MRKIALSEAKDQLREEQEKNVSAADARGSWSNRSPAA